jgi:hypothetical protein
MLQSLRVDRMLIESAPTWVRNRPIVMFLVDTRVAVIENRTGEVRIIVAERHHRSCIE